MCHIQSVSQTGGSDQTLSSCIMGNVGARVLGPNQSTSAPPQNDIIQQMAALANQITLYKVTVQVDNSVR